MRNERRKLEAGFTLACLLATLVARPVLAAPTNPAAPASRYASIVVEAETGNVLYERNADLQRCPASLTKIMTLYLTFEALASKKLKLGDEVVVSAYAAGKDPSKLNVAPGTRLRVEDAIRAMTTKSANDAACAMAEALGKGSETKFAEMMNAKAKALGLQHTTFRNASGLPEDGHLTTARDLAVLSRALVRDYPQYYSYFATDSFEFHGTRFPNQNRFLRTYYGADGIKTGFINASGHNLAASAVRGGKRLIAIVLGGETQVWTRQHAARLLDVSYAKIDPSLVMVASNAEAEEGETEAGETASAAETGASTAPAAGSPATEMGSAAAEETYATPAGAVTVRRAIPAPNGTANLTAYAAAVSTDQAAQAAGSAAEAPAPSVPAATPATSASTLPATTVSEFVPASEEVTEDTVARELLGYRELYAASTSPPSTTPAETSSKRATVAPALPEPDRRPVAPSARKTPARTNEANAAADEQPLASSTEAGWSVQIGVFRDATVARRRGEEARSLMPIALRGADLLVDRAGDGVHITSRIGRLSEQEARLACSELQRGRVPCVVVPPGRPLVVATN